jgi:hypothetical protein
MKVLKELAVAVASYEDRNTGQMKNRYKNIGVLMETENNGQVNRFLMLDRSFNPAGVPFKQGSDKILISMFDPKPRDGQQGGTSDNQQSSQQDGGYGAARSDMDGSEIPF